MVPTATNVNALVYDTDIRAISTFPNGFDFKALSKHRQTTWLTLYLQLLMLIMVLLQVKQVLAVTLAHSRVMNGRLLGQENPGDTLAVLQERVTTTVPLLWRNKCNYGCNRWGVVLQVYV